MLIQTRMLHFLAAGGVHAVRGTTPPDHNFTSLPLCAQDVGA